MSSHKNIIFFTKDPESEDSNKFYDLLKTKLKFQYDFDDREHGMGWSEHYYYAPVKAKYGISVTYFKIPENWDYFGIEDIDTIFKDYKIIAKISEKMDYENPEKFAKSTIEGFKFISSEMGENDIYVLIYDDSSSEEILYLPILNNWKGNFYDKAKRRDINIKKLTK